MAFSLLICCSLVCNASLRDFSPFLDRVCPTILPGISLLYFSLQAKYAAWGPPKPIGTPNLCILPTATSTPNSEIGLIKTCASGSIHAVTIISDLCAWDIKNVGSYNCPFLPGNCNNIPKTSS